jgi:hypothetical protein
MPRALAVLVVAAAPLLAISCGRIGFDTAAPANDASPGTDSPTDGTGSAIPIAYGQGGGSAIPTATSLSVTLGAPVTAGDLLLLGVSYDGPLRAAGVFDSLGDTFTEASAAVAAPQVSDLYYALAVSSAPVTVSASIPSPGTSYFQIQVWTYHGIAQTNPLDDCAQAHGTTTAVDGAATRPLAVTTSNELVFEWAECVTSCAAGTGFMQRTSFGGDGAGDRIVTTTGTDVAGMTLTGSSWTVVGATFRGQ